jgi:hypothetical protein
MARSAFLLLAAALIATACTRPTPTRSAADWPGGLRTVGDGWPAPGDPCRVIGETRETVDFLDHDATLVGCLSPDDAARLRGRTVATVAGVTLVSVPARVAGDGDGQGDALVAGTGHHATATVRCEGFGSAGATRCDAGVRRHGPGGTATVDILWPQGGRRVLLFDRDGRVIGAEAGPGDARPALPVVGTRIADTTVVTIGTERYEVPDVFVLGD